MPTCFGGIEDVGIRGSFASSLDFFIDQDGLDHKDVNFNTSFANQQAKYFTMGSKMGHLKVYCEEDPQIEEIDYVITSPDLHIEVQLAHV